jgi:hypothetical protein
MADEIKEGLATSLPVTDQDLEPFRVLKAVSQAPVKVSPAQQLTDAVTGSGDDEEFVPQGPATPANVNDAGKPGTVFTRAFTGNFKKGPAKGMDKNLFFSMLADTLVAVSGVEPGQGPKFTRMAIERRAQQSQLAARQQELEDERAFRQAQADADRTQRVKETEAGLKDKSMDRAHDVDLKKLELDAKSKNAEKLQQHETEMLELSQKVGQQAASVAEVFDGISTLGSLRLPPHITPETAMADPAILEEARRLIAPHKERQIFQRIEAQNGTKVSEKNRETLAVVSQAETAWRNGVRMVSPEEQQATGLFQPFTMLLNPDGTPRGSLADQAAADVAATGPERLQDPVAYLDAKQAFMREAWDDFLLRTGGSFQLLDRELQAQKRGEMFGNLGLLYDAERDAFLREVDASAQAVVNARQEIVRNQFQAGEDRLERVLEFSGPEAVRAVLRTSTTEFQNHIRKNRKDFVPFLD